MLPMAVIEIREMKMREALAKDAEDIGRNTRGGGGVPLRTHWIGSGIYLCICQKSIKKAEQRFTCLSSCGYKSPGTRLLVD